MINKRKKKKIIIKIIIQRGFYLMKNLRKYFLFKNIIFGLVNFDSKIETETKNC